MTRSGELSYDFHMIINNNHNSTINKHQWHVAKSSPSPPPPPPPLLLRSSSITPPLSTNNRLTTTYSTIWRDQSKGGDDQNRLKWCIWHRLGSRWVFFSSSFLFWYYILTSVLIVYICSNVNIWDRETKEGQWQWNQVIWALSMCFFLLHGFLYTNKCFYCIHRFYCHYMGWGNRRWVTTAQLDRNNARYIVWVCFFLKHQTHHLGLGFILCLDLFYIYLLVIHIVSS